MTATTKCLLNNSIICRQWGWWVGDGGHRNVRFMSWNKYRWKYNTNTKLSVIKILRETRIETWKMGEVIFQGGSHRIVSPILPRHTSSSCNTKILLSALQKYNNKYKQKFKWSCWQGLKDRHVGIPAYKSSATIPWSQSVHPSIASSSASPWNTSPLHPIEINHQMHLLQILNRYKCIPLKCIANTTHPKWNTLRSIQ